MSRMQLKIIYHIKNQINHNLNKKRQLINVNTYINHVLELIGQDFKTIMRKNASIINYKFS